MQEYCYNNLSQFIEGWQSNRKYFDMLGLMAQLSRLFSESDVPYLDYRLTENLFCRYFGAQNDARSCTAYDARLARLGIGIKTFILSKKNQSVEKIAEFNKLKKDLDELKGKDLARKLGVFRNERMNFANNQYNVNESQYHIIGRQEGLLRIFNSPYEKVDIYNIHVEKDDATSCVFNDERNEYIFNKSKSVLMKRFVLPTEYKDIKVKILANPLELLEKFFENNSIDILNAQKHIKGVDYVILPLYSEKHGVKYVPEKSGLNQFNAGGRLRKPHEIYIPVPRAVHKVAPGFFPERDTPFILILPDGSSLSAKICQDGSKALMSNPNDALGDWILGKVLNKKDFELVTINDLDRLGFDSVCIERLHSTDVNGNNEYRISFSENSEDYENFVM